MGGWFEWWVGGWFEWGVGGLNGGVGLLVRCLDGVKYMSKW